MNIYYVYQYLREDQTPYYIGKGKENRAWVSHRRSNGSEIKPKDKTRIQILKEGLTEKEAFSLETELIMQYGLKSEGGILVNMTYGGEGRTPSNELREHWSKVHKGIPKPPRTEEHKLNHKKASERMKGVPNFKTAKGLKEWYATNPDRSETIAKQSASLKKWYNTINKESKAWNTWHTRYEQDYNEYARAIILLQQYPIVEVARQVKFQRDTLRKLKNRNHGVYKHFPELLQT
jgi:hypothetical protein